MRVRITKCSDDAYWYKDFIGKTFEVNEDLIAGYFELTDNEFKRVDRIIKNPEGVCGLGICADECVWDEEEQKPTGIKYDKEKTRFELLPFEQLEQVAKVLTIGAKKYADDNWKHVKPRSRYIGATMRHLFAWLRGEKKDPETGESHLAHAVCCLLFLMWGDDNE